MKSNLVKNKVNDSCNTKYGKKRFILTKKFIELNKEKNNIKAINIFSKLLNIDSNNIIIENGILIIKNYCMHHNEFKITKNNIYNRIRFNVQNICTKCNPINDQSSINEKEIGIYINNILNINNNKIKIENYEIDVYVKNKKIGFEYDGLYWHSDIYKDKNYHLNKTELCEKQGIQLLHIFEDEWIHKKEIVKSIIKS